MVNNKKWKSVPSYPKPVWVQDTINKKLYFNVAMQYKIKLKADNFAENMKSDVLYTCDHCKESKLFLREKNNPEVWKCVNCHSIIETGK
jgi:predicted SprT family Zn-dependent metalloprotease